MVSHYRYILVLFALMGTPVIAAQNLIIVTLDGLRWQEVFYGADPQLVANPEFVAHPDKLKADFVRDTTLAQRQSLMPFMWTEVAQKGTLIGDRRQGSLISISNSWHFSYPGYNEIFSGKADPDINSNQPVPNPNISFVEYLNQQPEFGHRLAVFGSWDVFPAIFNQARSKLHINAGFESARDYTLGHKAKWLNQLQEQIPSPWHNVRLDAFTFGFALDYMQQQTPRVVVIALGETDDFAHDGNYQAYLEAAQRNDRMLADLWHFIQSHPFYRDQTNLLITTDHGRGSTANDWQHHASAKAVKTYMTKLARFEQGIEGSEHIWLAAIGPDIQQQGLVKTPEQRSQSQLAATALTLLELDYRQYDDSIAPPLEELLKK